MTMFMVRMLWGLKLSRIWSMADGSMVTLFLT
jgi:hypothetical protein